MSDSILSPKTFLTYTPGCRVNQAEVSAISSQLSVFSFQKFNPKTDLFPNLVLINTCAVTQKAERESRKAIHHFKRLYPKAKIVAMGCAAKFVKDADLFIENPQKLKAVKIILKTFSLTPRRCQAKSAFSYHPVPNTYHQSCRALVKVQEGCDQFCSYCLVPYLRGKPKSTSPKEIICQINRLVQNKIKEIILCGINLSLYGKDLTSPTSITFLIKKILKETKAERISLSSIEPEYLYNDSKLAELFLEEPRLSKYFHLALQSGSQETVNVMGRKTNLEKLIKILHFVKEKYPGFTFRADVIVGFPTETEKEFLETLDFIKSAGISFVHSFQFSTRPGTKTEGFIKSGKWRDLVPAVKKERAERLKEMVEKIRKEEGKKLIGKTLPCLIIKKTTGGYEAMARNSWTVRISHQPALRRSRSSAISSQTTKAPLRPSISSELRWEQGKILPIKITSYHNQKLIGEI